MALRWKWFRNIWTRPRDAAEARFPANLIECQFNEHPVRPLSDPALGGEITFVTTVAGVCFHEAAGFFLKGAP